MPDPSAAVDIGRLHDYRSLVISSLSFSSSLSLSTVSFYYVCSIFRVALLVPPSRLISCTPSLFRVFLFFSVTGLSPLSFSLSVLSLSSSRYAAFTVSILPAFSLFSRLPLSVSFSLAGSTPLRLIIHTSESHPLLQRHTSGTDSMAHHFIDLLSPLSQVSTRIFHRFMQASPTPARLRALAPGFISSPINRSCLRAIREDLSPPCQEYRRYSRYLAAFRFRFAG